MQPHQGVAGGGAARTHRNAIEDSEHGRSLWTSGPLWALIGFLSGAIFWHFVGFWDFVGGVVLRGPGADVEQVAVVGGGSECITLSLDRTTGMTTANSCPALIAALPESRRNYRGSLTLGARQRVVTPQRWTITVSDGADEGAVVAR